MELAKALWNGLVRCCLNCARMGQIIVSPVLGIFRKAAEWSRCRLPSLRRVFRRPQEDRRLTGHDHQIAVERSDTPADSGNRAAQRSKKTSPFQRNSKKVRFFVDSVTLNESYKYVCPDTIHAGNQGFREVFHYTSGLQIGRRAFVINHLVPVTFSRQTAGGVRVADSSNILALEHLDQVGLPLVCHFHSHPGFGPNANHPSGTDLRFQSRLESAGHIAIGGIFSRDGYLRFFAGDGTPFVVVVRGKRIKKVQENVYKLEFSVDDGDVPFGANPAGIRRRSL